MFSNAPGSIAFSQEHFKTISYAKLGGQIECIMGNWKIVNSSKKIMLMPGDQPGGGEGVGLGTAGKTDALTDGHLGFK